MEVFLSHSTNDKNIVNKVANVLGPQCVWIDTAEIDVGDIIVEKIANGISHCTDFVLFWSKNSANSPWVRLELHMALIKSMEQQGCAFRIVKLDSTELPLYLKPYLYLDGQSDPTLIPERLSTELQRIRERTVRRSRFVNRHNELARIESIIDDPDIRVCTLTGISGIGKKAILQRMTETLFTGANYSGVDVKPGLDMVALALMLATQIPVVAPKNFSSEEELAEFIRFCIESLHAKGSVIVFHDVHEWIQEDGSPSKPLEYLFQLAASMRALTKVPMFFTTTRRFEVPVQYAGFHHYLKVAEISTEHISTIINHYIEQDTGNEMENSRIYGIAQMLCGYPFAARLAAGLIMQYGIDHLEKNPVKIVELKVSIAKHLVGEIPLQDDTARLLEILSVADAPLPAEDFASVLGFTDDQFRTAIEQAADVGLLSYQEGHLVLHPLVQDYYFRSIYGTGRFPEVTGKLAKCAKDRLSSLDANNPVHYKLMLSVFRIVALSGDLKGALEIRQDLMGYLEQVVRDLYDSRDYVKAFDYAEQILSQDPSNWEVKFVYARCLTRLDELGRAEQLLLEMLQSPKEDKRVLHALGRLEMARDNYPVALEWFSRALAERPKYVACLRDSAECFLRMGEWNEAEGYLMRAKEIDEKNPFVLQLESRLYEERGEYDKAYEVMDIASKLERNNSYFLHRLGRISELKNDLAKAKEHYQNAVLTDNKSIEARLSLVSVLIDLRELDDIPAQLKELGSVVTGRAKAVLRGIHAKYMLAIDQLDEASKLLDQNMSFGVADPSNYGLRAQVELRRSEIANLNGYAALAKQGLLSAMAFVDQGLKHHASNRPLINLKATIEERIGRIDN